MTKRALLIGCNYPGTDAELKGCVNDVKHVQKLLIEHKGFHPQDVVVMIDTDPDGPQPTGANIRKAMKKLGQMAQPGDTIFFHFSGHGVEVPPETPDPDDDGLDQCICPTDMNLITDDDFRDFADTLPSDVDFTLVSDSCHSGGLIERTKEQVGPKTAPPAGGGVAQGETRSRGLPSYGLQARREYGEEGSYGSRYEDRSDSGYRAAAYGYAGGEHGGYGGYQRSEEFGGHDGGYGKHHGGHGGGGYQREEERQSGYGGGGYHNGSGGGHGRHHGGYHGGHKEADDEGRHKGGKSWFDNDDEESEDSSGDFVYHPSRVKSKSLPLDIFASLLSQKSGQEVGVGNIRTTIFKLFGDDASPTIQTFVGIICQHGPQMMKLLQEGDTGGLMKTFGQLAIGYAMGQFTGGGAPPPKVQQAAESGSLQQAFAGGKKHQNQQAGGGLGGFLTRGNAVLISGCQSNETSADVNPNPSDPGSAHGALTFSILEMLKRNGPDLSYKDLVLGARDELSKRKFTQHPCLYTADHMLSRPFITKTVGAFQET